MSDLSSIVKHCIWADTRVINLVKTMTEKEFTTKPKNTGRSVRDLCVHISSTYLYEIDHASHKEEEEKLTTLEKDPLLKYWSDILTKFGNSLENNPDKPMTFQTEDKKTKNVTGISKVLAYTDHSTYHRAQLNTTFKFVTGREAVNVDYFTFMGTKESE